MAWNVQDRFPKWGQSGQSPPAGFFYEANDQVNEKHFDYLWNGLFEFQEDVQTALNDIDSDKDGRVDDVEGDAKNVIAAQRRAQR